MKIHSHTWHTQDNWMALLSLHSGTLELAEYSCIWLDLHCFYYILKMDYLFVSLISPVT